MNFNSVQNMRMNECIIYVACITREQGGLGRLKLAQRSPTSHVTRTPVSRSEVKVTRPLYSARP